MLPQKAKDLVRDARGVHLPTKQQAHTAAFVLEGLQVETIIERRTGLAGYL